MSRSIDNWAKIIFNNNAGIDRLNGCPLINGMPVIHIELKRSGVPVSQATGQIGKYAHEGVFTGLFRLVQIFVGLTPDEARYFANPGLGPFSSSLCIAPRIYAVPKLAFSAKLIIDFFLIIRFNKSNNKEGFRYGEVPKRNMGFVRFWAI